MNCHSFKEHYYRYLDGEISESQGAEMDQHLKKCAGCRREAHQMKDFDRLFRPTGLSLEPSSGFDAAFWEKVAARRTEPVYRRWLKDLDRWLPVPTLVQAAAVLLIAFLFGGTGGAVLTLKSTAWQPQRQETYSLTGFPEFAGIANPSIAETYLKQEKKRP